MLVLFGTRPEYQFCGFEGRSSVFSRGFRVLALKFDPSENCVEYSSTLCSFKADQTLERVVRRVPGNLGGETEDPPSKGSAKLPVVLRPWAKEC